MTNPTELDAALTEALKHPGVRTVERVQAALAGHVVLRREAYDAMVQALEWYSERVLTYAITQANEPRSAAHADKGARAREALAILRRAECPHPARDGRHEAYLRPDGSSVCRACGAELGRAEGGSDDADG